jgi:hypothetical protein
MLSGRPYPFDQSTDSSPTYVPVTTAAALSARSSRDAYPTRLTHAVVVVIPQPTSAGSERSETEHASSTRTA